MEKISKQEYLAALEAANVDDELVLDADQDDQDQGLGEMSEAERLAAHAEGPTIRVDGKPYSSPRGERARPLTTSQIAFTQGIIQGKTYRQAYKDAYPNAQGSDSSITTSAYKLSRDPRVQALVQDALDETVEHLAEDVAGTKRYVLKQLIAHSKGAKQEGTKLKALELLGKSVGLFIDKAEVKTEAVTAEQLKRELGQHLKLLPSAKRSA
jgi:predicted transcriptional regulator